MSATATASTSGHRRAARKISLPREPPPIRPNRIRSFEPRTRPVAAAPAPATTAPVAPPITDPRKARRWDMACLRNGGGCSVGKRPRMIGCFSRRPRVDALREAEFRQAPAGKLATRLDQYRQVAVLLVLLSAGSIILC